MAYVAVKGGTEAIENAYNLLNYQRQKGDSAPLQVEQIQEQLYMAVDRIMSEGGLYAPQAAALALKQSAGWAMFLSFLTLSPASRHATWSWSQSSHETA